ncbi:MAG: U32 family peptidase [Bacilli bacterium]|nr:U32 family peptidase [Bacilli bacterium]
MKLLIEVSDKSNLFLDKTDGIILPIDKYSVESICTFSLDEIKDIVNKTKKEVFIKINKNIMNDDINDLKKILIELDNLNIKGIFFYDLALLQLKKELNLKMDLVWNQTHMVNNYKTCNYYYSKGVKYALLGKEITLDEIIEIIKKSDIISMVEVVSHPSVAFSKRKLLTNYYINLNKEVKKDLIVTEKMTDTNYHLIEDDNGTTFYLDIITNGTSIIKSLYEAGCKYIIFREYGIDDFEELIDDTEKYINGKCIDDSYVEKYKKLGDSTNFFFKKTIYKVKK